MKGATAALEIPNENAQKVVTTLTGVADKAVGVLTDNNPDDAGQFKKLLEEEKGEFLELGLDIAEDELAAVKNETTKVLGMAALKIIRQLVTDTNYVATEADVADFLQAAKPPTPYRGSSPPAPYMGSKRYSPCRGSKRNSPCRGLGGRWGCYFAFNS